MKYLKKWLLLSLLYFSLSFSTFWLVLQIPPTQGQKDIIETGPSQVQTDESTLFQIIQIINKYLWFIIWWVAMIIFVVAGFKLISSGADPAKTSAANKMLIGSMIAILLAIFSYALVRILINLL